VKAKKYIEIGFSLPFCGLFIKKEVFVSKIPKENPASHSTLISTIITKN
jgi:hypothetical protein